ncbi:MAG TPA: NADH-quinone oxidoreductase subunit N [Arachidicoccus soli]|nr:NADH-quinone oxidoreductase subunit N [Arachidicoccus soli]
MIALIILFLTGIITLFVAFSRKTILVTVIASIGLIGSLFALLSQFESGNDVLLKSYKGLNFDAAAVLFSMVCIILTLLFIWIGYKPLTQKDEHAGEHIALLIFSLCGALIMTAFQNFFMFFIGLEILSIPVYVMAGMKKYDSLGSEAALKYFLTGAFSTGILLFGIAWIYGATGSFDIMEIKSLILGGDTNVTFFSVGLLLVLASFLFKVSIAPFHFWSPDVYAGSTMTVMGYMATIIKIAGFAAILRLFNVAFSEASGIWLPILVVVAVLSIFIGNLSAIKQTRVRRLLAFSSIAHAGYTMLAIISFESVDTTTLHFNVFYYLLAYSLAMVILTTIGNIIDDEEDKIDNWVGIARKNPILGIAIFVALFSLAGVPPTMGFFGKYLVFGQAIAEYPIIVGIALLNSGIAVYYYLMLAIKAIKMPAIDDSKETSEQKVLDVDMVQWTVLIFATIIILIGGFALT